MGGNDAVRGVRQKEVACKVQQTASWENEDKGSTCDETEDMWQKPGDHAKLPQFVYGNSAVSSSRWMLSTNHVRLKNVTLGFTIPQNCIKRLGLNKVRAYASANNLFTIKSGDLYVDPEVPANGIVTFETPALRTVTFGIEIGF